MQGRFHRRGGPKGRVSRRGGPSLPAGSCSDAEGVLGICPQLSSYGATQEQPGSSSGKGKQDQDQQTNPKPKNQSASWYLMRPVAAGERGAPCALLIRGRTWVVVWRDPLQSTGHLFCHVSVVLVVTGKGCNWEAGILLSIPSRWKRAWRETAKLGLGVVWRYNTHHDAHVTTWYLSGYIPSCSRDAVY